MSGSLEESLNLDVGTKKNEDIDKHEIPHADDLLSKIGNENQKHEKAHHEDDSDHHMCRVCRSDEGNLFYPCLCTGSIKYVHQECLMEWLKYSKKEVCELCNYKYSFQPIYRSDMPKALPVLEIIKGIALNVGRMLKTWVVYTIVLIAWLGIVPLTAARIYQAVFSSNIHNIIYLPLYIFNTDHIVTDCAKGIFLLGIFICTFISLVWLREQIIHGGPQDWLQIDVDEGEEPVEDNRLDAQNEALAPHDAPLPETPLDPPPNENDDLLEDRDRLPPLEGDDPTDEQLQERRDHEAHLRSLARLGLDPSSDESSDYGNDSESEEEEDNHEEEPQGEQGGAANGGNGAGNGNEDNWRDWDRLGDELTWQRLLGLDGSFVFLEHVFWVISLNTLFTVLFVFSPFKLGTWILTYTGVRQKIAFFPSLTAILTGYVSVSVMVFFMHHLCGLFKIKSMYRLLGIVFLVLKVFLLVLMEIGFFPIMCGWWMDLCSLPLLSATLSSRLQSFVASPSSSLFLHWMIGMIYVFYSASFVLLLREVLRPGVLWFMRNLNDPEFNPIQEMIELPVARHLRRLIASTSLFFMAILLIVYFPLRIIQKVIPPILPYNISLSAETPLSELSLELLILQVVLPALLEQTHARTLLKKAVRVWCVVVGKVLKLDRYLLSNTHNENNNNNEQERNNAPAALAADGDAVAEPLGGGGLAAEHQALLLLREPLTFEPYVRPSYFPLRIIALVTFLSMTATFCSCLCCVIPVTIGRFFIYKITGLSNVHELYTVGAGLYICWMSAKVAHVVCEWLNRGGAHLWNVLKNSLVITGRLVVAVLPPLMMIPFLLGVCFQLVVVSPLRVGLQQTPLFYPWQEWAMGVLHMKIFCAGVMMGPDWWMKQAFEQLYVDGVQGLRLAFVYRQIVLPVLVALSMQIAVPFAVVNLILMAFDPHIEDRVVLHRFCYPFTLSVVVIVAFVIWQMKKLRTLAQDIRNEKYLVGTQLVNYERGEEIIEEQQDAKQENSPE